MALTSRSTGTPSISARSSFSVAPNGSVLWSTTVTATSYTGFRGAALYARTPVGDCSSVPGTTDNDYVIALDTVSGRWSAKCPSTPTAPRSEAGRLPRAPPGCGPARPAARPGAGGVRKQTKCCHRCVRQSCSPTFRPCVTARSWPPSWQAARPDWRPLTTAMPRCSTATAGQCWHEPADAADAVQDTFVIAAAELGRLRDPDRLRPWLYAVAGTSATGNCAPEPGLPRSMKPAT